MGAVCRRAERQGLLRHSPTRAQIAPIARQVIREMARRGQIDVSG